MKNSTFTKYEIQAFLEEKLMDNTATDQEYSYYIDLQMNDQLTYNQVLRSIVAQMNYWYNN